MKLFSRAALRAYIKDVVVHSLILGSAFFSYALILRLVFSFDAASSTHWRYIYLSSHTNLPWSYLLFSIPSLTLYACATLLYRYLQTRKTKTLLKSEEDTSGDNMPGQVFDLKAKHTIEEIVTSDKPRFSFLPFKSNSSPKQDDVVLPATQQKQGSPDEIQSDMYDKGTDFSQRQEPLEDTIDSLATVRDAREFSFFADMRNAKDLTEGDLAASIHMWLKDYGWLIRPDLVINGDMGITEFSEDGFSDDPSITIPMFAFNGEFIRLFTFVSHYSGKITLPDAVDMIEGPLQEWTISSPEEGDHVIPCPIGQLIMAKNRLIAGYGNVITEIFGDTDRIIPTLVTGHVEFSNVDVLTDIIHQGHVEILPFMTPGSVPDILGDETEPATGLQNTLLRELLAGEKAATVD